MTDQDCHPPTLKARETDTKDPYELVTMENFFKDGPPPETEAEGKSGARSSSMAEGKKFGTLEKIKGMMKRRSQGAVAGSKSGKDLGESLKLEGSQS